MPLTPTLDGYYDPLGKFCGGVVLPGLPAASCILQKQPSAVLPSTEKLTAHPIVWRVTYPQDVADRLVTYINPGGGTNNSNLELVGGVLQHCCAADCYDVRKRTVLSRTNNSAGMRWIRKGLPTCTSPPAQLLRLHTVHQRHHRYVPRHGFDSGVDNDISDVPSCLFALSDNQLLAFLNLHSPQSQPWRMCTPPPESVTAVFSVLRRKISPRTFLQVKPALLMGTEKSGRTFV